MAMNDDKDEDGELMDDDKDDNYHSGDASGMTMTMEPQIPLPQLENIWENLEVSMGVPPVLINVGIFPTT